ncbi:hypothetical protein M2318_001073 [Metapseudomonas resinovorans]|uniref:hypothetical protein n=1 Tax=Metapseudomonas resinovorans TaxID=53412 RepID=UPI003D22867C
MHSVHQKFFFSPALDFMLIGGLSLIAYAVVLAVGVTSTVFDIAWWMWVLAFFVNGPHFLISYEILYAGHRERILHSKRFFWAAVVVPAILLALIGVGFAFNLKGIFQGLLFTMFFTVGWHYIKQAYGCFIVYSGGQGVYFDRWEQLLIRGALFPLWWASFLRLFTGSGSSSYWGLEYSVPPFLVGWVEVLHFVSFLGLVPVVGILARRWLKRLPMPSITAVTPLVVIYVWLSPFLSHPFFLYMIPFFHSLQYLLFSGAYTRSKVEESGKGARGYLIWWGGAFILGALAFHVIPVGIDDAKLHSGEITSNLALLTFILFINIHHYFIDNVLWRGDNPQVRQALRMRERAPVAAPAVSS